MPRTIPGSFTGANGHYTFGLMPEGEYQLYVSVLDNAVADLAGIKNAYAWTGVQTGSDAQPFNTPAAVQLAAPPGATVKIKPGTSVEKSV